MCSLGHGFPRPLNWKQIMRFQLSGRRKPWANRVAHLPGAGRQGAGAGVLRTPVARSAEEGWPNPRGEKSGAGGLLPAADRAELERLEREAARMVEAGGMFGFLWDAIVMEDGPELSGFATAGLALGTGLDGHRAATE